MSITCKKGCDAADIDRIFTAANFPEVKFGERESERTLTVELKAPGHEPAEKSQRILPGRNRFEVDLELRSGG
jgi:hypothetical protein